MIVHHTSTYAIIAEQLRDDRQLMRRLPLGHRWRGCVGLAILLLDRAQPHEGRCLLPARSLLWLGVRDVPGDREAGLREARLMSLAHVRLRYGQPHLDLEHHSGLRLDLARLSPRSPHLRAHPRTRSVAMAISAAMTQHAQQATDRRGRPLHPRWADLAEQRQPFKPARPMEWLPRPYLAFRRPHLLPLVEQVVAAVQANGLPQALWDHLRIPLGSFERRVPGREVLSSLCGGRDRMVLTLRDWLVSVAVDGPLHDQILVPAWVTVPLGAGAQPLDLWFDVGPALSWLDERQQALLLPPLPLEDPWRTDLCLPHDLRVVLPQVQDCQRRFQHVPQQQPQRRLGAAA